MSKRWLLLLGLVLACGSDPNRQLVSEAPLISQSFTDDTGRKLNLPNKPDKVVSIAPNITEMIFAMGGEEKLAARSQACNYPPGVEAYPEVSTFPALDLEQIKATNADIIITTDEIFSPDDIQKLERLNVPIYLQSYQHLSDVYRCMKDLGKLLDQDSLAEAVADSLEKLEQRVTEKTQHEIKYGTVVLIAANPDLLVVGGKGYMNELLEKAGGKNLFGDTEKAYVTTTVEEILSKEPEFLILPSDDDQVYADLLALHPALYNTPADLNKQVHIISPDLMYRPGPRMLQGLLNLTHILHTQLSPDQFIEAR